MKINSYLTFSKIMLQLWYTLGSFKPRCSLSIFAKGKIFGPFINMQHGGLCKIHMRTSMW